jgi:hypothetical protein
MQARPLVVLAALAAATEPDLGRDTVERFKERMREGVARDPMGTVLYTVLVGAWLFYRAEKGKNPKCTSFYDALVYVSTNLSVGYAPIFAETPVGKAIGTAVMTYGPAISSRILDAPNDAKNEKGSGQDPVIERLDKILAALTALREGPPTIRDQA